jgi:hypothetical protein
MESAHEDVVLCEDRDCAVPFREVAAHDRLPLGVRRQLDALFCAGRIPRDGGVRQRFSASPGTACS